MSKNNSTIVYEMALAKETKNTGRYEATTVNGVTPDDGLQRTVYMQKADLGDSVPASITVTIEVQ